MSLRDNLKMFCEKYHGQVHVLFGLVVFFCVISLFSGVNPWLLFFVMIVGSFLPDIDHLFFMYWYGRSTEYSIKARKYLDKGEFGGFINYCKKNHKNNTYIISHNLLTPLAFFIFGVFAYVNGSAVGSLFWWSMSMHFVFDVLEDILFFGKLNGNWIFLYGKRAVD